MNKKAKFVHILLYFQVLNSEAADINIKNENDRLKVALAQSVNNAKKMEAEILSINSNNQRLTSALKESHSNADEWKKQYIYQKEELNKLKGGSNNNSQHYKHAYDKSDDDDENQISGFEQATFQNERNSATQFSNSRSNNVKKENVKLRQEIVQIIDSFEAKINELTTLKDNLKKLIIDL